MKTKEFLDELKKIVNHAEKNPAYLFTVEDTKYLLERYENSLTYPKKVKWGQNHENLP